MMSNILEDLKEFLHKSPSPWHAAAEVGGRLAVRDFTPLDEKEKWELEKGKSYFVIRGGSICAFTLPKETLQRAMIIAAHTDSPALKLKPRPEIRKENMTLFGVEVYGSPLISSWLNRDLCLAGRVSILDNKGQIEEKLVYIDDAPFLIPQLAVHLDRDVNEKGLILNKQEHLSPLVSLTKKDEEMRDYLETLLRRSLSFHSLLAFDLFLVPLEESRFLGSNNEMLASYRIDNLTSVHATTTALALTKAPLASALQLAIFWDHEEVGSRTAEGASSPFLSDVLKRITLAYNLDEEEEIALKQRSLCVSVDMAHAFNSNYPSKYEPNHQPLLGKGIVLKYNADQRYATNAQTAAPIISLCEKLNLPLQRYVSRSDIPAGSTVGPHVATALGIPTCDIGCAQLSMHAARELIACQDYLDLTELLKGLYEMESL